MSNMALAFPFTLQWVKNKLGVCVRPLELILFVTNRCNFRCDHCFIEEFDSQIETDLPLDTIKSLADDIPALLSLMITGGEPFLRDDLPEIIKYFAKKSRPQAVSIVTNGHFTEKIVSNVEELMSDPSFLSQLVITLSFEGDEEVHNRNRKKKNSFQTAMKTARALKDLTSKYPRLAVGANLTVIPENQERIGEYAEKIDSTGLFSYLTHNIYRESRPKHGCTKVSIKHYEQLSRYIAKRNRGFSMGGNFIFGKLHRIKEIYQSVLISRVCKTQQYQGLPCEGGRGIGVVFNNGSVTPCEILLTPWGNIKTNSFGDIWQKKQNRKHFTEIRKTKCFCTHECFLSASLALQPTSLLKSLFWYMFIRKN